MCKNKLIDCNFIFDIDLNFLKVCSFLNDMNFLCYFRLLILLFFIIFNKDIYIF